MNQDDLVKQVLENENGIAAGLRDLNLYKGSYLLCLNYRLEYKRITPELYNELVEKFNSLPIKQQTKKDKKHSKWNDKEWAKHQFVPNPLITKKEKEEEKEKEKWKLQQKRAYQVKKKRDNETKFKKVMRFIFWPYKKPSSNRFWVFSLGCTFLLFYFMFVRIIIEDRLFEEEDLLIFLLPLGFRYFAWTFDKD